MNWHDFAFFDPVMYESLRQLILASQSTDADAVFAAMDLAFAIDLCKEEGGGQVSAAKTLSLCSFRMPHLMRVVMYTSSMLFSDGRDNVLPFLDSNIVLSLDN